MKDKSYRRENEKTLMEFWCFQDEEKQNYFLSILEIPIEERTFGDEQVIEVYFRNKFGIELSSRECQLMNFEYYQTLINNK